MDELTQKKYRLEVDSKQLDSLRDKAQRMGAEIRELRQQKVDIKLGLEPFKNAEKELSSISKQLSYLQNKKSKISINTEDGIKEVRELENIITRLNTKKVKVSADLDSFNKGKEDLLNLDKNIASINRQKLEVEADIQPIRTANTELYKVNSEIDRINNNKIKINVSESLMKAGSSVSNLGDGILKAFNPLTSKINQMIGFGLVNNLVGKGIGMITGSVDSAISRVDTLNNYAKVMSNLNISQEQADNSRKRLVEGLQGLPTALDKGVSAVQRFTSANNDIGKSTEMFLALNNAILAGGADSQIQESALEQISQAYSKGKPDMMEWRSLLTAMPAQINQVAKSFDMTSDQLGESLRNGDKSMDEFMNRIVEMNTTGAEGFKSFSEQAKNAVDGVKTGIANMNTAVNRGVAGIINTVDKVAKERGLGGISGILSKIGSLFEDSLGKISDLIEKNQDKIFDFIDKAVSFLLSIDYISFFNGIIKGTKEMGNAGKEIFKYIEPIFSLLGDKNVTEGIGTLIPSMLMLGVAIKGLGFGLKVFGLGAKGIGGIVGLLGKITKFKMPSFGGSKVGGSLPFSNVSMEQLKSIGLKLGIVAGLSANVYLASKAIQEVTKIQNMDGIYEKLAVIALAVSGMGLITVAVDQVATKLGTNMVAGLLVIAGIAGEIYLMSIALEKLGSIDIGFVDIQKKIGSIALVIVEIGALAGVVGLIMSTGIGAVALGAGLVAIAGIALEIMLLAETIKQLDEKVPSDFGNIEQKINNIISVLETILDSELASLGSLFDSIVANFTTGSIIKTIDNLIVISEKLKELNSKGSSINSSKINKIISSIQSVLNEVSLEGGFWSSIGKAFKNKADSAVYKNAIDSIDEIIKLAERTSELQKLNINKEKVEENINAIKYILSLIDSNSFSKDGFKLLSPDFVDNIDTTVYYIIKLFERIKQLESLSMDITKAQQNLANVKGLARMLTPEKWEEFNDGLVNLDLIKDIDSVIEQLTKVAEKMNSFIDEVPENGTAQESLYNIRGSLRMLKSEKWKEFEDGFVSSNIFNGIIDTLTYLEDISKILKNIAKNKVELREVQDIILNMKGVLRMLKLERWSEFTEGFIDKNTIEPAIAPLEIIKDLAERSKSLTDVNLERGKVQDVIMDLRGALRLLSIEKWIEYEGGFVDRNLLEPVTLSLDTIIDIAEKMKSLAEIQLDGGATIDKLVMIRGVLRMLYFDKWTEYESGFVDKNLIEPVILSLETLKEIADKMLAFQSIELDGKKINDEVSKIKGCLRMIRADSWIDFQNGFVKSKDLEKAVEAIKLLKSIADKFNEIGEFNAKDVIMKIMQLKGLLRSLYAEKWKEFEGTLVSKENLKEYADLLEPLRKALEKMSEINADEVNIVGIQKNITGFMGIMKRLTLDNFPDIESVISSEMVDKATATLDSLIVFGNKLPTLGNLEFSEGAVISRLVSMKRIIDTMNEFSYEDGADNATNLVQTFIDMANKMTEMANTTFNPIGKSWGEKTIEGFKQSEVPKTILSIADGLINNLNKKSNNFRNIGTNWGNSLKNGFNTSIKGFGSGIDSEISNMSNKANLFLNLGNTFGRFLNDGFNNALLLLDNTISSKVSNLQQNINNINNSANSNSKTKNPKPVVLASGGKINSNTGFARIIDSSEQPVLRNGEGILPKRIMEKIGMPFFENLRRGNISPTFSNLSKNISNTTSSVINNFYNNNTTNQSMVVHTTSSPELLQIANRRLR
ncbi:MAG: tape measure [Caudoviricetes sp.]|nr:MAG: tape measure [Caudoviricetes sp.]